MKNIQKEIKRISAGAAAGLIVALIPLALSAQETWSAARGFSQPEKTGQVKVRKVASTATTLKFEYSLPSASIKNGSALSSASRIALGNTPQRQRVGEPNVPVIPVQVILPAGTTLEKAVVTTDNSEEIQGSYRIEHGQKPVPLNGTGSRTAANPDAKIYGSDTPYPAERVEVVGIQKKRGVTIAIINIFPVSYRPQSGKVVVYKTLNLEVTTKPLTDKERTGLRVPPVQKRFFPSVENPEDLDSYSNESRNAGPKDGTVRLAICDPNDSYRYVIVTADSFATAQTDVTVRDLIAQKQSRGISATIVTIENVRAQYTGVDDAERLRNFIIDAYSNWETEFVLLGGDINIIPMRRLYCYAAGETDQIPSDLYFQCLDGNFNSDNDNYWGETTDGPGGSDVDLMAEVYIGRASAENRAEMSNFVYKTLAYENAAESSPYLRRALMVGEELGFGGVSEYATASMEEIRLGSSEHGYTTAGFASSSLFSVDTLYDRSGYEWPRSEIISRMNSNNFGLYNHLGHANANYVMKFYNADADALTNTNPFFAYSQGCIPGNFEVDCVAEHLTTSHRRGAFAVVFNSRYGWGRYNSTDGPSQRFNRQFWDAYFSEFIINLGTLNADSHEDNLWDINGDCIRWCYYETNLLGDPQTQIRGLIGGPMVQYSSHIFNDNAGNSDGLINPGERIVVIPTVVNVGSESASGVTMTLSTTDSYVTMVDNTASAGTIACCGALQQALDNIVINVASNCPTPHTIPFTLTIRDNNSGEWTSQFSMTVYTSSLISGYVRASASGAALPNATVSFSGPLNGSVTTDASGRYLFGGIDGTYSVTAVASEYLQSSPLTVIVPPSNQNVNFDLVRPVIGLAPNSILVNLQAGETANRTLTVSNSGDAVLSYSIAVRDMTGTAVLPAERLYSADHFVVQSKGTEDRRIGKPVKFGSGGPDESGYRWTDSDESNGPVYQWTDIRNTGTLLTTISNCDDCYQAQALSFEFPFYGNNFSSIYVSSNGYITFGAGSSSLSNYPLPSTSMPSNLVAAYFDDLDTRSTGDVYFQDFGNRAVVQFTNVAPYSGSGTLTYQMVLEENGTIFFYYNTLTASLTSTTAGIQNGAQNDGLTVVYNAAYLKNNLAVRLRPVPDWLTVTPESGTVPPGGSNTLTVRFSTEGLNGGFHYGALAFTHNDPQQANPVLIPCTLYVDGMRRLAVTPTSVDFGTVLVGASDTVSVTLTNSGDEPVAVSGIASSSLQFTHNTTLPLTVPPFASVEVRVAYHPVTPGNHTGNLTITSNAEDNPVLTVDLAGTSVLGPDIEVTPVSHYVNMAPDNTTVRTLTIGNTGGANLEFALQVNSGEQSDVLRVDVNSFKKKRAAAFSVKPYVVKPHSGTLASNDESLKPENRVYVKNVNRMANNNILIFRDNLAWSCDVNVPLLEGMGATVSTAPSSQMTSIDLEQFDVIIFESQQSRAFYTNYNASSARFDQFLRNGGIMSFHTATFSTDRIPELTLPGGMRTLVSETLDSNNMVNDSTHPLVQGSPAVMTGSYASHEAFSNLPSGARVIVANSQGQPTTVEYNVGQGLLLATGMTWEWGYYFGNSCGNPILPNAYAFILSLSTGPQWLTADQQSGTIVPGGNGNVILTFNSSGLVEGTYSAEVSISHNSYVAVSPVVVPVTLVVSGNGSGGFTSMITSAGISALVKAQGTRYSLSGITLGAPVTGTMQGNRYRLNLW